MGGGRLGSRRLRGPRWRHCVFGARRLAQRSPKAAVDRCERRRGEHGSAPRTRWCAVVRCGGVARHALAALGFGAVAGVRLRSRARRVCYRAAIRRNSLTGTLSWHGCSNGSSGPQQWLVPTRRGRGGGFSRFLDAVAHREGVEHFLRGQDTAERDRRGLSAASR